MNPWDDDRVEQALGRFYRATTASVVTPEVEVIVARAHRRRATNAVLTGVAVVVTLAIVMVLAGPLRRDRALPPIGPTTAVTEPVEDGRADASGSILSGFLDTPLLRSADDAPGEDRDGGLVIEQCRGAPIDHLRTVGIAGDDKSKVDITLYLYEDEDSARSAFATATADLRACMGFPGATLSSEPAPSYGDEAAAQTFLKPADGAGELTNWPVRVVAVRVGRVVEVFFSMPYHTLPNGLPAAAASPQVMDAVVAASVPRLCLYHGDGCTPAPGLPTPIRDLARDEQMWLLLLRVFQTDDTTGQPGASLAAAAEAGYHPSIVRPGCDAGLELNAAEVTDETRYLALYFRQRTQADEAAAELLDRDEQAVAPYLDIRGVATRCVS